ncbi:MAG: glycosyltransferase [Chlamydiota bacterium]
MKHLIFLFLSLTFCGCQEKKDAPVSSIDFEHLMGKGLNAWQHVVTREDGENYHFFKAIFEKNGALLKSSSCTEKIPKVLHFIWIGPNSFPKDSLVNLRSWIGKHPDWTINFWTDRERPLPHPAMHKKFINEITLMRLSQFYDKTDNFAEKSDLLRYEILFQYGGVYVDHDVKCFKAFDEMNKAYDLFCGLEVPFATPLSSSIFPTNNLIGARSYHPIIARCIDKVCERWDTVEKEYPGNDRDAVINRIAHRTFSAFGESVKECQNQGDNKDIVFPAFFFNAPKDHLAIYARHEYKGTWFENESKFEKSTRERLMYLSKKVNKILLISVVFAVVNVLLFSLLLFLVRKRMF